MTAFRQLGFMRGQALGFDLGKKLVIPVQSNLSHLQAGLRGDQSGLSQESRHPQGDCILLRAGRYRGGYYLTTREAEFRGARAPGQHGRFRFHPPVRVENDRRASLRPCQSKRPQRGLHHQPRRAQGAGDFAAGGSRREAIPGASTTGNGKRSSASLRFHYRGMQEEVRPLLLDIEPSLMDTLTLSVRTTDQDSVMRHIRAVWESHFPGVPPTASFLDERFDRLYRYEEQMSRLLALTTILGLIIACLGLFGLAYFTAGLKRKEIGIRRVLGASPSSIVALLSKRFAGLVLLSALLAGPAAWFAVNWWLQGIRLPGAAGRAHFRRGRGRSAGDRLATVGLQGWKAARKNPVNSLRNE
ncbi:MAG: hypothetical protein MZU79_01420 [Anaerotruncus sp.]|nr:hypothetical protein [Anaerotruncus sp.]